MVHVLQNTLEITCSNAATGVALLYHGWPYGHQPLMGRKTCFTPRAMSRISPGVPACSFARRSSRILHTACWDGAGSYRPQHAQVAGVLLSPAPGFSLGRACSGKFCQDYPCCILIDGDQFEGAC